MVHKTELIERIKYASKYNKPCPAWVYKLIEATPSIDYTHLLYDITDEEDGEW